MSKPFVTYDPVNDSWDVIYRGRVYPFATEKYARLAASFPESLPAFSSIPLEMTNDESD
jgi:hypothetical protein